MFRERPFIVALIFSALFHLSMVTVFSVGIWFPVTPTRYYTFRIVPQTSSEIRRTDAAAARDPDRRVLRDPSTDHPLDITSPALDNAYDSIAGDMQGAPRLTREETLLSALPDVQLPRVEFAGLDRLRLQRQSLEIRSRHEDYLGADRGSTWPSLGRGLARLRDALSHLPFFEDEHQPPKPRLQRVSVPAEGFEVYIEWMSEPKDRRLLFSPPIDALAGADPRVFAVSLSFVFRVGPDGRVREILPGTIAEDSALILSVARALTNYRFAPLEPGDQFDQYGTLILTAAASDVRD